jgi:hypothetical protein
MNLSKNPEERMRQLFLPGPILLGAGGVLGFLLPRDLLWLSFAIMAIALPAVFMYLWASIRAFFQSLKEK